MNYYQDKNGKVHELEDAEYEYLLPASLECVAITREQAHAILNPIESLREQKCGELEAAYIQTINSDIEYTSAGGITKLFQADEASVASLSKSLLGCEAAEETPVGFFWKATDNTRVPFTYADLRGLASAMFQRGAYWFAHLSYKKDAANSAQSVSELNQVNW